MGSKKDLQVNNTDLQEILDIAKDAPLGGGVTVDGEVIEKLAMTSYKGDNPYTMGQDGMSFDANTLLKDGLTIINGVNGEGLTETASTQTAEVQALLREINRKVADHKDEGLYVWKKYTPEVTLTFDDVESIEGEVTAYKITSSTIDVLDLDETYFYGFMWGNNFTGHFYQGVLDDNGVPQDDGIVKFKSDLTEAEDLQGKFYVYNGFLYIYDGIYKWDAHDFLYSGNFVSFRKEGLVSYVVSSDSEAYPDGAAQDGFWYERASEELTPEFFGCTEMSIDKFSFTTDRYPSTTPLHHSLNKKPKVIMIKAEERVRKSTCLDVVVGMQPVENQSIQGFAIWLWEDSTTDEIIFEKRIVLTTIVAAIGITETTVTCALSNAYKFIAGEEYTLITMA